ncbi:MAG: MATE family efflux transporter [Clostridia bacterium]|nr:MATE family efflux transporter [Clostridia bacterium]
MQKIKKTVDMTEGPFFKKMLVFAIPIILTGLLQCLYNAADLVVVGQFRGDLAVAAVGSTGSLTHLIVGLFRGLSVGAGVCVAHHIGSKEPEEVKKVLHTSVVLSLICGVVIAAVGYFFSGTFLELMDTPPDVLPLATLYMRIFFLGAPGAVLYNYIASMMRSAGDSKHPLIFLAVSGVANILLNVFLIVAFDMGVDGVAIATITSQYLSAIMATVYLIRHDGTLHLSLGELRIHGEKLKKILQIGIPSGIQGILFSLSNVLIQSSINSFGDAVVAGSAASASLEGFLYIAMNSVYHVALTFIGQSVGARKFKNIKPLTVYSCIIVTAIGLIGGAILLLFRSPLISLYVSTEASTAAAMQRLWIIGATYFLCGLMEVFCAALRAVDRSVTAMVISLGGVCGLRILWIQTVFRAFPSPETIYISYPITWIITLALHLTFTVIISKKMIRKYSENT